MEFIRNKALEFLGQSAVDVLKNSGVSEKISWLQVKLPRARQLIERYKSLGFLYKPIDQLLPQLNEAVNKAEKLLGEFDSQKQRLQGSNWRIQGELSNNFRNWISSYPNNVISAHCLLDHVCSEMEKICSMLPILNTPNQFNEHISRLSVMLPRAKLLIERSECWRLKHKSIHELLPLLKEAVYKAEIEKDDIEDMKWILEGEEWRVEGELLNYLRNWIAGVPDKVKFARNTLDDVCNEMEKLCQSYNIPENPNQFSDNARPITRSRHPDTIYGRNKELKDAINLLRVPRSGSCGTKRVKKERKSGLCIQENSSSITKKRRIPILPIVGMGGVGKTTLAQGVYKDKNVQSYFELQIWICVSDKFDLERLMKEIIECSIKGKKCNLTNLNMIEETLEKELKSKRVLLVLDDIWSKHWKNLLGPMNETSEGSAIILTTRSPQHLQCTGDNMTILKSISLEGLEEEIYWDFFRSCAGLDVTMENYSQLEVIAKEICVRLKGSPLAAKTLGGILKSRIDEQYWIEIRDSKMWELKQEEHDIMPVLQLSYQHLPSHLKKCLSFCSQYPKDHEFTDIELVRFWIMQGLIKIKENLKDMESLALDYFHELKNGCFFHSKTNHRGSEVYVIHDLMHDVCQFNTIDECYCIEDDDFGKISDKVHHVSIFQKKVNPPRELQKFQKLQSLLVASVYCSSSAMKSWCELTSIRRLSFSSSNIKSLPENIGKLEHLQYLDISGTGIKKLPNSFWTLYKLQHLDMNECREFLDMSGFLEGSKKLKGLRFFRSPPYLVAFLISIPNLLRAMQRYNVEYHVKNDGRNKIENLKHLKGVHGFLQICGLHNVSSKEAAEEAELSKQEFVDVLCLSWSKTLLIGNTDDPAINETHSEVLNGLRPHLNLSVLNIYHYEGQDLSPSWMADGLPNLRRVYFQDCWNHTISQLPRHITELILQCCKRLTSLNDCLRPNLLPELKCITIDFLPGLVSLPVESFSGFASLEKLWICSCHKLTCPREMVLPPSLKVLNLDDCGELDSSIPNCLKNLVSLEVLELRECPHVVYIPDDVMRNLKSLRRLLVCGCGNLSSLGDEQFLESIKDRSIEMCPKFKMTSADIPSSSNAPRKRKARAPHN